MTTELFPTQKKILAHFQKWEGQLIPYHEIWSLGVHAPSIGPLISDIRAKTGAEIINHRGKGYIYHGMKAEKPAPARPACGPRCKHPECRKFLEHYEIKYGECLSHIQARNHAWRYEAVRATA